MKQQLTFRHRMEDHELAKHQFEVVSQHLAGRNRFVKRGMTVDATIVHGSVSTKNAGKCGSPETHPTHKGNQCHFELKLQVDTDLDNGLMHPRATTVANAEDVLVGPARLCGAEPVLFRAAKYLELDQWYARRHQLAAPG